jgi:hypothetical protein
MMSSKISDRGDLILPLEKDFPEGYREYYATKRNNFFAGVTGFSDMWKCFVELDEIMQYDLDASKQISELDNLLPFMLFAHAHAQLRIALELGFTGSFPEAFNIARMAVESAYQAHKLISQPELATIWFKKDRGETQRKEFKAAFDFGKRKSYTALGLGDLHRDWTNFSEWSHPSVSSLNQRFSLEMIHYFETDPKTKALNIYSLLFAAHKIENALFMAFASRLKLDYGLETKRIGFAKRANKMRLSLVRKFNFKPPGGATESRIILVQFGV